MCDFAPFNTTQRIGRLGPETSSGPGAVYHAAPSAEFGQVNEIAPSQAEVVALRGVAVVRDGTQILSDIDWSVHGHQCWVVLGPNGAGKTTMLQVASTYLGPTRGIVRLLGETYGKVDVRKLRARIGYAGAGPAELVAGRLPALEIVVTGKYASFVDKRWNEYDDADWAAARLQLDRLMASSLADRKFSTLSTGEKQRVLIARSLMANPDVLFLDEATTGLDLGARERLVAALADLAFDPDGPAIVLVTHHVEEIPPGFDHIAMMADGRLTASGSIDDVLTPTALSDCFGQKLNLDMTDDRYRAWASR
ncbi:MAG: ATP-binding cassette domain-containing protein [bacterium]|nr:ATP-binding cassette domain-containing protein [bacterium]